MNGTFLRSLEYLTVVLRTTNMIHIVKHHPDFPDDEITPEYMMKHLAIIDDMDSCIRRLYALWEANGGVGMLLMIGHNWNDKAKWVCSTELLAKEVVPTLPTI